MSETQLQPDLIESENWSTLVNEGESNLNDKYIIEHSVYFSMLYLYYNMYKKHYGDKFSISDCLLICGEELSRYHSSINFDDLLSNVGFMENVVYFFQDLNVNEDVVE